MILGITIISFNQCVGKADYNICFSICHFLWIFMLTETTNFNGDLHNAEYREMTVTKNVFIRRWMLYGGGNKPGEKESAKSVIRFTIWRFIFLSINSEVTSIDN